MNANPYMVLTCFDELQISKGLGLMRGDVIQSITRLEGQVLMEQLMDCYLVEHMYERVRQFNHDPNNFDH
jgi:hypothetical protein